MLIVLLALALIAAGWLILRSPEPSYQGKSVTFWIHSLTNNSSTDRTAEEAFRKMGLPAIPYLITALEKDDNFLKKMHIKLWNNGPKFVRKFIPEPFPWRQIRSPAIQMLGHIGGQHRWSDGMGEAPTTSEIEQAVHFLINDLTAPHSKGGFSDVAVLAYIGPNARDAVPALAHFFEQADEHYKVQVCQALGTIGPNPHSHESVQTLLTALNDPDENLNQSALGGLQNMAGDAQEAIPQIIKRLDDSNEGIRRHSIRALARIGHFPESLRPKLITFLNETNDSTRAGAAIALLRLDPNDTNALAVALDCLRSEKPNQKSGTVFLIMPMGSSGKVLLPELRRLTNDADGNVSTFARKAIKHIERDAEGK